MKYGRKDPLLSSIPVDTFPSHFKEWWRTLQPTERGEMGDERPAALIPHPSWHKLTRSGRNGLYLVLLGLFWWRHTLEAVEETTAKASADREWELTAIDILWVLSAWNAHHHSPTPPPSPSSPISHGAQTPETSPSKGVSDRSAPATGRKRKRGTRDESTRGKRRK